MKKRILAALLTLVLSMTLAVPAFAQEDRTLSNQEIFALLPNPLLPGEKPQTLQEAEYFANVLYDPHQVWKVEKTGVDKETVFLQIVSLTESLVADKSSDTEKAKAIYQWVTKNIQYDRPVLINEGLGPAYVYSSPDPHDAFYTFALRTGVCEGYTRLCYLMFRIAGLPGAIVSSDSDVHTWNAVCADGRWILFDATHGQWDFGPDDHLSAKNTMSEIQYQAEGEPFLRTFQNDGGFMGRGIVTGVEVEPKDLVIPDGVTKLSYYAFDGCPGLASVVIPNSVTKIGSAAFRGCFNLTSVVIPDSVTEIGNGAFGDCDSLTSVVIPGSVTKMGNGAFGYCDSLTSVVIQNGVTEIGDEAFWYCPDLTSIVIPASVTKIGNRAFPESFYSGDKRGQNPINIYYSGSEEQWKAIGYSKSYLEKEYVTIHYNCQPVIPANTSVEASIAYASTQSVLVDGKAVQFQCYALKDETGNDTNYIKLRDLADILNGSAAQFQVGWDGGVTITTKTAYTPNGSEQKTPFSGNRVYEPSTAVTKINGRAADLAAIVLTDDAGGGYTYYQLRDLGKALGFNVGWAAGKGIFVETDKPYDANN